KCIINAEVFRKILDIYQRVEGEEFTEVQDNDATLTFLIDLGYKGLLHKYTNMYVDHMHPLSRTLAAIINKCLSGNTASNDRLRRSRIDILWGMFYKENVDYLELIWEDFAFQIDHKKEQKLRRKTMPFPRFTKVITNHFLSQHKSLFNLKYQHYHIIKDDGIISRLKFVRVEEDYQEYGLPIPDMMLNDAIKQSESYQMFIKYSTGQILPKKSKGKGSQGKKTSDETAGIGGSNEGTGVLLGVPDESTIVLATSSKGTEEDQSDDEEVDWIDFDEEKKYDTDDDKSNNLEMSDDKEIDDEFVHGVEQVNDDEDEEMTNAEVEDYRNDDEENTDAATTGAGKTKEVKDDAKKVELPLTSSSLLVSLGFGDQFLKLSSDTSLVSTIKDTTYAEINSLLDIKIQSEVPYIQSSFVLRVPVSLRVAKLEKDVSELKKLDHFPKALTTLKSQVLNEPIKKPIVKVAIDDTVNTVSEDVVRDDDQPQDTLEPKTDMTQNPKWFKQPPRSPTPDPE
nr:hypothetical protein [Tanacetum cinerariifolium]